MWHNVYLRSMCCCQRRRLVWQDRGNSCWVDQERQNLRPLSLLELSDSSAVDAPVLPHPGPVRYDVLHPLPETLRWHHGSHMQGCHESA